MSGSFGLLEGGDRPWLKFNGHDRAAVRQESAGAVRVGRWELATRDACGNNALTVRTQAQSLSKLFLQSGVLKGLDQFFEAGWFHHLEA